MSKKDDITYKIRPAARLIHTIGSDLIGDAYAALVELVKNSYDADAEQVTIKFENRKVDSEDALVISIVDDGHGMSFDTVINKWLVPATNYKLNKKKSLLKERVFQGQKGIGRFAASLLGQEMTLTSIDLEGEKTTAVIDWRIFKTDDFLENIELLVEKEITNKKSGTKIEIIAKNENSDYKISQWNDESMSHLINELRKLISPFKEFNEDKFEIELLFKNCSFGNLEEAISVETYPIIEFYDYRISGSIDNNGNADFIFENNVNLNAKQKESITIKYSLDEVGKYCGKVNIDFRVFDREASAIDNLINKGLIDPVSEKYMGKNETRRLLNEVYGVNIYKNFFRIRPYGNAGVDWLKLDNRRIQNPSQRISNNQIVGFITIEDEEKSGLEEKSARDGLKENDYFSGLKELSKKTISELERRRFIYRVKSEKGRVNRKSISNSVSDLFSFYNLKNTITEKLQQYKVDEKAVKDIKVILEKEEKAKAGLLQDVEKTIAIYQGQATLGKIVNFILHEGRKPLQFFNSETRAIERYINHYKATREEDVLIDLNKSIKGFRTQSGLLSNLFKRIDPLAKQKRGAKKHFSVKECVKDSFIVFKSAMEEQNVKLNIESAAKNIEIYGWSEDLIVAMTNLIENSIYWLSVSDKENREIEIEITEDKDTVMINYWDNGPGLSIEEIDSGAIFEPGYTKKMNGTGLGLAIAGEAVERLNGKLIARDSKTGVYFQIEIDK